MPIAGLILAAGGSTRMKKTKQLLPWGKRTLLQHVIQTVRRAEIDAVFITLGADARRIRQNSDLQDITVIAVDQWEEGLGRSLAAGVQAISTNPDIDACLVLLADQPFITSEHLNAMIREFDGRTIIASNYEGRAGVPCLFPRRFFSDLVALQGDQGAGQLLKRLSAHVRVFHIPADLRDIDTIETYRKYRPR